MYWALTTLVLLVAGAVGVALRRLVGVSRSGADGLAARRDVNRSAGRRSLLQRAGLLRPAVGTPTAEDVGVSLGRAGLMECWASIEDSVVVLGPPRSGKGLHLVVPTIVSSPGAVLTTSTRPDNLAATLELRRGRGPVAIFDPQGLADGVESTLRWSPIGGCESPATAMARARALTAEGGHDVDNASFWAQQSNTAVRCLLHAAALGRRQPVDLVRWSLSTLAAEEAVDLLRSPAAAPAWSTALEAILTTDPRQRDSTWSMVANAFSALADPRVLAAISPAAGEEFDPEAFLAAGGTLYLLGTASGASATATLISALVEDVIETARRLAAGAPAARLEPPLAVILDEAANYPLPSLLPLMSEGGGSGISTWVVLQSLAQARARWGQHEAAAVWDAATTKIVLGGSSNADDLRDLSALIGTRRVGRSQTSRGADGRRSTTISEVEEPVLSSSELRTLLFGQAVLLLRSCLPIRLTLRPWTTRKDADLLRRSKAHVEAQLASAAKRA